LWKTVLFVSVGDGPRVSTKELLYLDDAGRLPRIRILYEIFTRPSICLVPFIVASRPNDTVGVFAQPAV